MQLTLPRRRFFVTAGLVAGGALSIPVSQLTLAQSRRAPKDDPVLDHVGKEMTRLYRRQRSGALFYAEHYETLAANLRLLAISFPEIRELAKKRPVPHDRHERHKRSLEEARKRFGVDLSGEVDLPPVSEAATNQIRARLAREGLAPTLLKMADLAETRAKQVARHGNDPLGLRVQLPNDWSPWCSFLPSVETASHITCLPVLGLVAPEVYAISCSVATITLLTWRWFC